ncbi:winged helix-turn-helix transcriptional regulator [Candidatus Woesearchaeota archaeon]|nr:winged helix-turn-helix transcriptional regulator [Candidatus Woesearchaeota archaeon]
MAKQSFLLVSLQEDKAKKLAQAVSNESCRKILDYLAEKEATEMDLAERIGLPVSTVHYNLKQLGDAGLISAEEFHYSKKGKEVKHYKLANKYIIIAPKSTFGLKEKLKSLLPALLIASGAALAISLFSKNFPIMAQSEQPMVMEKAAAAPAAFMEAGRINEPNIAMWFFAGAVFALSAFFIASLIKQRKD